MSMQVTDKGIDWQRLLPEDFDTVASRVTTKARAELIDTFAVTRDPIPAVSCKCGEGYSQRNNGHYVDMAGREVCLTNAYYALREVAKEWNSPLARAASKAPTLSA